MKTETIELIEKTLKHIRENNITTRDSNMERLMTRFNYNLTWFGEDIFVSNIIIEKLTYLLTSLESSAIIFEDDFNYEKRTIENELLNGNLHNSTCPITNTTKLWERRANQKLFEILKSIEKMF